MNIFQAFLKGWLLVIRFPIYCILKYGLTLIFTFLLLAPLTEALNQFLANRDMLADQAQNPSLGFIFEFIHHLDSRFAEMGQSAMLVLVVFVVLNVFLSSGILYGFAQHQRGEKIAFMVGVRRHFLSLALFVLVYGAVIVFASRGWDMAADYLLGAYPPVWMEIMAVIFQIWVIWLAWLVYDMTRVIICASPPDHGSSSMNLLMAVFRPISSLFRAIAFVFTKPSIWIVSLAFLLIQAFWILGIQREWFTLSGVGILLFGQLIVLARTATSMALWGAETSLWVMNQASKTEYDHSASVFETTTLPETEAPYSEVESTPEAVLSPNDETTDNPDSDPFDEDAEYLTAGRHSAAAPSDPEEDSQGSGN